LACQFVGVIVLLLNIFFFYVLGQFDLILVSPVVFSFIYVIVYYSYRLESLWDWRRKLLIMDVVDLGQVDLFLCFIFNLFAVVDLKVATGLGRVDLNVVALVVF